MGASGDGAHRHSDYEIPDRRGLTSSFSDGSGVSSCHSNSRDRVGFGSVDCQPERVPHEGITHLGSQGFERENALCPSSFRQVPEELIDLLVRHLVQSTTDLSLQPTLHRRVLLAWLFRLGLLLGLRRPGNVSLLTPPP